MIRFTPSRPRSKGGFCKRLSFTSLGGAVLGPGILLALAGGGLFLAQASVAPLATPLEAMTLEAATLEAPSILHLRLDATEPGEDATVPSPQEIRLFFSEAPQMRGTSVRLADAEGALVAGTEAAADEDDPSQVYIIPDALLGAGSYTVHWRVIAQDGHAQNGSFGFSVAGQ